jgi:hypothetical protein
MPVAALLRVASIFLALGLASCESCVDARRGDVPMCGACARTGECSSGLGCVNGVCETAPPSCHVKIGL